MSDSTITKTESGIIFDGEEATKLYALISAKHMLKGMKIGLRWRGMTQKKVIAQIAKLTEVPVTKYEEAMVAADQRITEYKSRRNS